MSALDVGAFPVIAALILAPAAARRVRRNAAWVTLMSLLVGVAAVFGSRNSAVSRSRRGGAGRHAGNRR